MGCINLVRGKVLSPKDLEHSAGALAEAQATGKYETSGNLGQGWMGSVPISALMGFEVERDLCNWLQRGRSAFVAAKCTDQSPFWVLRKG
jgi:hypothetical protein